MNLSDLISNGKNKVLETAFKKAINKKISGIGFFTHLSLDLKKKNIDCILNLKGESEDIKIEIKNYLLEKDKNGEGFISASKIVTSREWINIIIEKKIDEKVKISKKNFKLLEILL